MLTKKNYQQLLEEISEKKDIIKENLYKNYVNACVRFQNRENRVYIQMDEDGKITKIFHGEYMPDVKKNLNRDDTICIASLFDMTYICDTIYFQQQQQMEEELRKEYNEKINKLDADDKIEIAKAKKEYEESYNSGMFQIGFFTDEELKATYDIESVFTDLYQYLENAVNNID